jgi:hypothetical protein
MHGLGFIDILQPEFNAGHLRAVAEEILGRPEISQHQIRTYSNMPSERCRNHKLLHLRQHAERPDLPHRRDDVDCIAGNNAEIAASS